MLLSGYYGIMVFAQKSRPIAGGINEKKRSRPDMERDRHGLSLILAILALPALRVLVTPAIGRCIRLTV